MASKIMNLFASLTLLFLLPVSAMGQSMPHTFTANTAAKASEVNANFTYLLERFGTRKTTVNCNSGESITTALKNYNHIVISGVCTENLDLNPLTLPHLLVILEGSSSSSDGIKASDTSIPVVDVGSGEITLKISKLKLTGGTDGIKAHRGPAIIMKNTLVENNSQYGIALWMGSDGVIKDSTIQNNGSQAIIAGYSSSASIKGNTISGHTNDSSILIFGSSGAYIVKNTITGGKHSGITIGGSGYARIGSDPESGVSQGNTIQSAENGIVVQNSGHAILKYNTIKNNSESGLRVDNNGSAILAEGNTFSNNSEYGIRVWLAGSLTMWGGAQLTSPTTISGNTKGPIRVDEGGSAYLKNLTLASQSKGIIIQNGNFVKLDNVTISGSDENGINVWGTNIGLEDSTISGSTDNEIYAKFSTINLEKTAITGTAGSDEIDLNYGSMLFIETGTTITGTVTCDGSVDNNSISNSINLSLTTSGC